MTIENNSISAPWTLPSGPILYNMTNDYMFKAVLQECPEALVGLVSALLMIDPNEIDVKVVNPIILGKSLSSKDFYLDVRVTVNDSKILNLEMQVKNEGNWPERTLSYTSRSFDSLEKGQDYSETVSFHQIGFTCFDIFPENNVFYDTFRLSNSDNTQIYSDKFKISVVNLKRIHEATQRDKSYKLDSWCRLITARTWEDLREIAKEDSFMQATVEKIQALFEDFDVQEEARRREEYYRRIHHFEKTIEEKDAIIAEKDDVIAEKNDVIAEKDDEIARLLRELEKIKTNQN